MNTQRFLTYAALAGGLVWLGKLAVLAATDGAESALVGTLYFSGLCLLALGSIGIAPSSSSAVRAGCASAAPYSPRSRS